MRMEERQLERENTQRRSDRLFQTQMLKMMMRSGAYHFPPPSNNSSLGQSNSSDQSSHSSTLAFGSPNM